MKFIHSSSSSSSSSSNTTTLLFLFVVIIITTTTKTLVYGQQSSSDITISPEEEEFINLIADAATTATQSQSQSDPIPIALNRYELLKVGNETQSEDIYPVGKIISLSPFIVEVYFEAPVDRFQDVNEGRDQIIYVEMYARVPDNSQCSIGYMVTGLGVDRSTVTASIVEYDNYTIDYPEADPLLMQRTTNGRFGKGVFQIDPSPFDLGEGQQKIYFDEGYQYFNDVDGQMKFCIRIATLIDYKSNNNNNNNNNNIGIYNGDGILDTVSYLDTKFTVNVDLTADFSSFDDTKVHFIKDTGTGNNLLSDETIRIDAIAYLCDDELNPYEGEDEIAFTAGQDFRFCVSPTDLTSIKDNVDSIGVDYKVVDFEVVRCSNNGEFRQLIANSIPDLFTVVDKEPNELGVLSFRSTVTSGFFNEGEDEFLCDGKMLLEYIGNNYASDNANDNANANANANDNANNGRERELRRALFTTAGGIKHSSSSSSSSRVAAADINTRDLQQSNININNNNNNNNNNIDGGASFVTSIKLKRPSDESSSPLRHINESSNMMMIMMIMIGMSTAWLLLLL
jgi:hypothetical protein